MDSMIDKVFTQLGSSEGADTEEGVRTVLQGLLDSPVTPQPSRLPALPKNMDKCRAHLEGIRGTPEHLLAVRVVALCAHRGFKEGLEEEVRPLAERDTSILAYQWLQFLISDESSTRNFLLQQYRVLDSTFYDSADVRPIPWKGNHREWKDALPWLKHPERLTITELELALVCFAWETNGGDGEDVSKGPHFVWWIQQRPAILWRVHAFLLKRYSFPLLDHFDVALRQKYDRDGNGGKRVLDRAPFRAGEFWRWYPRIGGLTAVGFLGVMSLDQLVAILFAAPWWVAALVAVVGLGILTMISCLDVFKQNRGVMATRGHSWPRVRGLVGQFLMWGLVPASVLTLFTLAWASLGSARGVFAHFDGPPYGNLIVLVPPCGWPSIWRFLWGLAGVVTLSTSLGALIQWFWEDKSATESI